MHEVTMGQPIVEYLERIDAALAPFGGHFIVHGGQADVLEGSPDIVTLRTGNSRSDIILADGVGREHRATGILGAGHAG